MDAELRGLIAAISKGETPSCILLHGDDFQVRSSLKELLERLVPAESRGLNLERFDGRTTPWEEIEHAIATPPLFGGRKVVLVEDAPYFLTQERRGETAARILQLWRDGKAEEAARLFSLLLGTEGWSEEKWQEAEPERAVALLIGAEEAAPEEAEEIVRFFRSRDLKPSRSGKSSEERLGQLLEAFPPWATLLLTSPHVDRRSRLYRQLQARGRVLDLGVEKERSGRISREALMEFIGQRLKELGKRAQPKALEMMLARAGDELWSVHRELEKLALYVGDEPAISAADVAEVFLDRGEAWVFDLTEALAKRDPLAALRHLSRLLAQGEPPLRLLAVLAGEIRRLISARELLDGPLRGKWKSGMSFGEFQSRLLGRGLPLLGGSPYRDYFAFQNAEGFRRGELLRCLELLHRADVQLKSTSTPSRHVLERLVLEICRRRTLGDETSPRA